MICFHLWNVTIFSQCPCNIFWSHLLVILWMNPSEAYLCIFWWCCLLFDAKQIKVIDFGFQIEKEPIMMKNMQKSKFELNFCSGSYTILGGDCEYENWRLITFLFYPLFVIQRSFRFRIIFVSATYWRNKKFK